MWSCQPDGNYAGIEAAQKRSDSGVQRGIEPIYKEATRRPYGRRRFLCQLPLQFYISSSRSGYIYFAFWAKTSSYI
jgi:hypothetical protein